MPGYITTTDTHTQVHEKEKSTKHVRGCGGREVIDGCCFLVVLKRKGAFERRNSTYSTIVHSQKEKMYLI